VTASNFVEEGTHSYVAAIQCFEAGSPLILTADWCIICVQRDTDFGGKDVGTVRRQDPSTHTKQ